MMKSNKGLTTENRFAIFLLRSLAPRLGQL